jgi:uncharacterized protein (TIGR03067 family)
MPARTKFRLQVAVALIALITGLQHSPHVRADDRAASAGMWNVMAVEMNGRQVDPEITAMIEVAYREDGSWTVLFKGMAVGEGTSQNNPEVSPKKFEMQTLGGKKTPPRKYSGIYKLEGDTRQLCFVIAGMPRPDTFTAPRGSGRILVTLKRAEKSEHSDHRREQRKADGTVSYEPLRPVASAQ